VEVQISVGAVLVHRSRGHPDRAVSGGDPGSSAGGEGQHSAAGVDDLMVVMSMRVDCPAGRQPLGAGRGGRHVADLRHYLADYRKPDKAAA
jgi:hypothetical protein